MRIVVSSEALSKTEIFQGLERDELSEIAALCREAKFEKGAFIFRESDTRRNFYLIMVVMVKEDVDVSEKEEALSILRRGSQPSESTLSKV